MTQPGSYSTNRDGSVSAIRLILLTIGVIVLLFLAWLTRVIVMLVFASAIFATLLAAITDWLTTKLKITRRLALGLLLTAGFALLLLVLWIRGPGIIERFASLQLDLPQAGHKLGERLSGYEWGRWLLTQMSGYTPTSENINSTLSRLGGFVLSTANIIGGLGMIIFIGIYLAAEPQLYLSGIRRLVPIGNRATFNACAESAVTFLRWWLISQMLSMIAVGMIVTAGLWALGVPLAGTLGIIAALLTFIPNVGPILSVVPAVLLAMVISPAKGFLVILLFLAVHFLEGNIITPLLERKIVRLPPALTLTTQFLLAVIGGPLGLAIAAPLTAVAIGILRVVLPDDELPPLQDGYAAQTD